MSLWLYMLAKQAGCVLFFLKKIEKKNTGIFGEIAVNLELLERNLGPLGEKQHIPIRISHLDCTTSFSTRKCCLPLEHPALPSYFFSLFQARQLQMSCYLSFSDAMSVSFDFAEIRWFRYGSHASSAKQSSNECL